MTPSDTSSPLGERSCRFIELLGKHERQLNVYVLSLVPNWADADEVVQRTRIRLWEQFDEYDPSKCFGAWARATAYYQVMTFRKQVGRQAKPLSDEVLSKIADDAAATAAFRDVRQDFLLECLEEESVDDRRLIVRCYSDSETITQIAESMRRSCGAVRQALFRIRRRLFECVQRKLAAEER